MNEHTGFELALSDYEKGYLTAFFDHVVLPDWAGDYSKIGMAPALARPCLTSTCG